GLTGIFFSFLFPDLIFSTAMGVTTAGYFIKGNGFPFRKAKWINTRKLDDYSIEELELAVKSDENSPTAAYIRTEIEKKTNEFHSGE
ncbi:MAG: hypothetical protein ACI8Q1_003259, partial [Parvicella sp.]